MSLEGDRRLILARADLAAASLEGLVKASRYEAVRLFQAAAPSAPILGSPGPHSGWVDELLHGERFEAIGAGGDYLWGQARRDGYVGFVEAALLGPLVEPPTHRVSAIRAYAFAEPSVRSRPIGPFSLNALVAIDGEDGRFLRTADGAFFWAGCLAPIGGGFERDPAGVAERFLSAPYVWGGRTSLALDCSGLIQQALYACGRACPRDADQQARLGRPIGREELSRGDLVCWSGHIGMMLDPARLIHASSHHMAVAIDPLDQAISRNEASYGSPVSFRRL